MWIILHPGVNALIVYDRYSFLNLITTGAAEWANIIRLHRKREEKSHFEGTFLCIMGLIYTPVGI